MLSIEKHRLNLGFIPLTDSAPLIVASELGFFEKWGLEVTLHKQNSWSTLRDKLHSGTLDAAQILAPMPLASTLGVGVNAQTMITPFVLSLNGNAITLSESLYQDILSVNKLSSLTLPLAAYLLKEVVRYRRMHGMSKLRFATVFPYSCHYYQLLDWLRGAQIDEREIDILIISPTNMVDTLISGDIDGFCVGGPWNAKAVRVGAGITALTSFDIWQDSPEKVLGLMESFNHAHPNTVVALCGALKEACNWLQPIANRFEAACLLATKPYLDAPVDVVAPSLLGSCLTHINLPPREIPSYNQFSVAKHGSINQPDHIRGEWLLRQMRNAGHLKSQIVPANIASRVFRQDVYSRMTGLFEVKEAKQTTAK